MAKMIDTKVFNLDKAFTMALYDEVVIKGFLPIYADEPDEGYTGA